MGAAATAQQWTKSRTHTHTHNTLAHTRTDAYTQLRAVARRPTKPASIRAPPWRTKVSTTARLPKQQQGARTLHEPERSTWYRYHTAQNKGQPGKGARTRTHRSSRKQVPTRTAATTSDKQNHYTTEFLPQHAHAHARARRQTRTKKEKKKQQHRTRPAPQPPRHRTPETGETTETHDDPPKPTRKT